MLGKQLLLKLKSNCPLKRGPIHLLSRGGGEGTGNICPKDSPQSRMTPLENSSSRAKQYGCAPPKRGGHPQLVPGTASKSLSNTFIQRRKQRPLPLMSGCLSAEGPCARVISDRLLSTCVLPLKGKSIHAEPAREPLLLICPPNLPALFRSLMNLSRPAVLHIV